MYPKYMQMNEKKIKKNLNIFCSLIFYLFIYFNLLS